MRVTRFIFTSLLSLTSFFCLAKTGITITDSIMSSGVYRKFLLYLPATYDSTGALPMVIDLHALGDNSQGEQLYTNFMPIADTASFFVVYPQGTSANPYWNAGLTSGAPFDLQFISELIDTLATRILIDNNRIYSCGLSNGGIMSYYLGCSLSDRLAAIASVGGTMYGNWYNLCSPKKPLPVMEIHGTQDAVVPFGGGGVMANIDSVVMKWVRHNNCNPVPVTYTVQDINSTDNCNAVNYRYENGYDGSTVELYKVFNGSASWPGAIAVVINTNQDFNASAEIWRFFRKYNRSQFATNVGLTEMEGNTNVIFPNPFSDHVRITGLKGAYILNAPDGKTIRSGAFADEIYFNEITPGMYFLRIIADGYTSTSKLIRE
jgi:polyhydroxybutyrate depolymerase